MSVIIRLQNLAWSANASDIREFFKGLSIPEGGVHIVGGEMGDAFIAFSTDEDARLASMKNGGILKGVQVTLSLSSRTQMQKVIESARQLVMGSSYAPPATAQPAPVAAQQPMQFPPATAPVAQEPAPMMQAIPEIQPQLEQERKHDSSMYRPEPTMVQNFGQQPFPGQVPQYTPMFPATSNVKLPVGSVDNYQVGIEDKPQQTHEAHTDYSVLPQNAKVTNTTILSTEEKDKTTDKQKLESDKRGDRRSDKKETDRKDRESRDDRRRRSKSRSRSRDRRRRHRSRSRDRNSRYRRSRSRDRDRGKDKDRRDRDRRIFRDNREKRSQESSESKSSLPPKNGIPGLGEIPTEIPKDKISIVVESPNEPITRTPHTRWGSVDVPRPKEAESRQPVDMEIEPVDMEIDKIPQERQQSPQVCQPPPFMRQLPNMRQPPILERQTHTQENHPQEHLHIPQNGRPGLLEPPAMIPNRNLEGQRFFNNTSGENYMTGRIQEGGFQPERRNYNAPFPDINMRNGPGADGPGTDGPSQGRSDWQQGNFHSMYSQRHDDYWNNNNKYDPRQNQSNFDAPPEEKTSDKEFWNAGAPVDETPGQADWPERSGHGRFSGKDIYRSSYNRDGARGRGGMGSDSTRGGGNFYAQRPVEYKDEGGNFRGRGRGFYHGRGMSSAGSETTRERKAKTCSIEILHVPFSASHKAIRDVFYGIPITQGSIKVLPNEDGVRSTTAVIRFNSTMDAGEAFKRRLSYIGDSQISINFIDDERYENAVDFMQNRPSIRRFPEQPADASNCVKITELPEACTESDIAQIFSEFRIANIVIERIEANGGVKLFGYIAFASFQDAEAALRKLRGVTLDGNYLKGLICPESCLLKAMEDQRQKTSFEANKPEVKGPTQNKYDPRQGKHSEEQKRTETAVHRQGVDLLTDSVLIKMVPCDLPQSAIHDFFSDEGIVPEKIYFGKPNHDKLCDIYVVFPQVENAPKAVLKTGQMLGPVKAEIELISKPTVMRVLGLPFDPLELFKKSNKANMPDMSKSHLARNEEIIRQAPSRNSDTIHQDPKREDVVRQAPSREPEVRQAPSRDHDIARQPLPRTHDETRNNSRRPDRQPMDDRHFQPEMNPRINTRPERGPMNDNQRDRTSYATRPTYSQEPTNRPIANSVAPERFGRPGCVVALANVAYSASTDDILKFFRGFPNLSADCVIRRYDELSRPTSDARVNMRNNEEAMRAVNTLNRTYMINRCIFVTLVNVN